MNTIESYRAITRRAIPLNYESPGVCHLPVPPGSGTGSSTPSDLDFNPVTQKAGPAVLLLTLATSTSVRLNWSALSYAHSYVIYKSTSALGPFLLEAANVLVNTYLDESLTPGNYYYRVLGIDPNFGLTTPSPTEGITVV